MRAVPWWGLISSAAAPVLLIGGWTVAAGLQPRSFNAVAQTISALAAQGAADRWVMTLAFLVVGACDAVTGLALRSAAAPGRLILMAGGVAGMLVAVNPEPARGGSLPHALWAAAGFAALTAWPAGAWRRGPSVPWGLRPAVSVTAAGVLAGLLAWFCAELVTGAGQAGLAERVLGGMQAAWPLAVVLSCRPGRSRARRPPAGPADDGNQDQAATAGARVPASGPAATGRAASKATAAHHATVIGVLLAMNGLIAFGEEHQAANAIAVLKKQLATTARVRRDGVWQSIPVRSLCPVM